MLVLIVFSVVIFLSKYPIKKAIHKGADPHGVMSVRTAKLFSVYSL